MIKKLRKRFSWMAVLLAGILLTVLFSILYFVLLIYGQNDLVEALRMYAESPDSSSIIYHSRDENHLGLFFPLDDICIVTVNSTGGRKIIDYSDGALNETALNECVETALVQKDGFGRIMAYDVFYTKYTEPTTFEVRIAFSNAHSFDSFYDALLLFLVIVFVIIMLNIYVIIRIIVSLCLKPVAKVWNQQQNFIADASHELKTPLTVILTNTNILMSHRKDTIENQMMWVNSTYEESTHMKDLVEKLLMLAKTDNLNQKKMFVPVDISELLIRLSLQYEPVAFESGVMLNTDIQNGITVKGEPTALNQVVHILLDNAVKYAGVGGEVTLSLRRNQKYAFISCTNTGDPIPAQDLPHIFERFYRSDKARTTGNGYGLGLAICKNLVDLHKGEISCSSNSVTGTTFTIKMRIAKQKK